MTNLIRVLHVVTKMDAAGIETLLMTFYRQMDRSKVQFDFLVHRNSEGFYDNEILKMGGRIYSVPSLHPFHHNKYINSLNCFFASHPEYKIVHSHINTFSMYVLRAAKEAGIPVRIAHSHIANPSLSIKTPFRIYTKLLLRRYSTHNFACSIMAGKWLFGKKNISSPNFYLVRNAIYSTKYLFDEKIRIEIRNTFNIEKEFVFLHVGRFVKQKNHIFLLNFFVRFHQKYPNSKLWLIGEGPLKKEVEHKIMKLGIIDSVELLGVRENVNQFMMAADCLLFPSIFEGLGIVAVEAQTSGLLTIVSNNIPVEANISSLFHQLPLDVEKWVSEVEYLLEYERGKENVASQSGYDVKETASWLQNFYLENFL